MAISRRGWEEAHVGQKIMSSSSRVLLSECLSGSVPSMGNYSTLQAQAAQCTKLQSEQLFPTQIRPLTDSNWATRSRNRPLPQAPVTKEAANRGGLPSCRGRWLDVGR